MRHPLRSVIWRHRKYGQSRNTNYKPVLKTTWGHGRLARKPQEGPQVTRPSVVPTPTWCVRGVLRPKRPSSPCRKNNRIHIIDAGVCGACDLIFCQKTLNPFRTAVPFWGHSIQTSSSLSPKRDCGSKRVNITMFLFVVAHRHSVRETQSSSKNVGGRKRWLVSRCNIIGISVTFWPRLEHVELASMPRDLASDIAYIECTTRVKL